jgi:hypothetical protein
VYEATKQEGDIVQVKTPILSDCSWAYIAGLIDGEGYIGLVKGSRHNQLSLVIGNTDEGIIQYLYSELGGSLTKRIDKRQEAKDIWMWVTRSNVTYNILQNVYKYLKIKKKQAELGMHHQEIIISRKGKRHRWHKLSIEEKQIDTDNKD